MATPPPPAAGGFGPYGIGDVLTKTFEVFKKDFGKMAGIAAIIVFPVTIVMYLLLDLLITDPRSIDTLDELVEASQNVGAVAIGATVASMVGVILAIGLNFIVMAALLRGAALSLVGDPTAGEAYKFGLKRLGSIAVIVIQVALIAGFGPMIVALVLSLLIKSMVVIWFLLAIIAAWYLSVRFSMAIPALVVENKRGSAALDRSWELVKDHFWHVVGVVIVAGILTGIVAGIIQTVFAFGGLTVQGIGVAIAYTVTLPFTAIVYTVLYTDLRSRLGGYSEEQFKADLAAGA